MGEAYIGQTEKAAQQVGPSPPAPSYIMYEGEFDEEDPPSYIMYEGVRG